MSHPSAKVEEALRADMGHVIEDISASGWQPPEGLSMSAPPSKHNRDFTIPEA